MDKSSPLGGGIPKWAKILGEEPSQPLIQSDKGDLKDMEAVKISETSELSEEQIKHLKSQELKSLASRIGLSALAILTSPAILAVGSVLLLSKFLTSKEEISLFDKTLSSLLLPAAGSKNFPPKPMEDSHTRYFQLNGVKNKAGEVTLDGIVHLADSMDPKIAVKMPCVVLFCPNMGCMEQMTREAYEYNIKGFNVVVFNYRGVNESKGRVLTGKDLEDDGETVVRTLLEKGLSIGHDKEPLLLKPDVSDLILDGASLGGAVAASVGEKFPSATLTTSRTFTSWVDAAAGLISQFTNPIFGKIAKVYLSIGDETKLDTLASLKGRLAKEHNLTFIESAGLKGDGLISEDSKLSEETVKKAIPALSPKVQFETHIRRKGGEAREDLYHHNSEIPLKERSHLYTKIVEPHSRKIKLLQRASSIETNLERNINLVLTRREIDRSTLLRLVRENDFHVPHQNLNENLLILLDSIQTDTPYLEEIEEVVKGFNLEGLVKAIDRAHEMEKDPLNEMNLESIQEGAAYLEAIAENIIKLERKIDEIKKPQ